MNARFHDLVVTRWGARFRGRKLPVAIGRGGIGEKQGEGDGITPVGVFEIAQIAYRADRCDFTTPALKQNVIGLFDRWSDDPKDSHYNLAVRSYDYPFSHEKLRRSDGLYNAFGVLNYNWPNPVAGAGSAIFIHAWRRARFPTEGCIAFAPDDLIDIFTNWSPQSRVIIRS
ncbi:hypothetical protein GCM10008927_09990 [Amylibacter ulvae]|uniref:L,D-TPase catalytic domain-containing protein n=1 Tax=Paramylibacter ulvae TaxID=1651968 RepID=A0ABQ3CWD6_9RHOB|nr:L,D-transpeptidase family protein [Amylibacter ulvae]GHA47200.1 hypothetical protein GCM10008927_09990 [Amylibacter ulvae]